MRVDLIVAAYALADELEQLVYSARSTVHDVRWHLFQHSRIPAVVAATEQLAACHAARIYPYGFNRGLAKSWNQGMIRAFAEGADVVVLVNDDMLFGDHALDRLVEQAYTLRDTCYAVTCHGYDHRAKENKFLGYSCIALNPICLDVIGCFDENLIPAYYEDIDYARRAGLLGTQLDVIRDLNVEHLGSASLDAANERTRASIIHGMELSRGYYIRKWGGDAHQEIYQHPFSNPAIGYKIQPLQRQTPYGSNYDRTDWVSV